MRRHLNHGGVVVYNTTSSEIVINTGLSTFPYGWRVINALYVSDEPMPLDRDRLLATLRAYRIDGQPVLDLSRASDVEALERISAAFDPGQAFTGATLVQPRESMVANYAHFPILTDDNMVVEWEQVSPQ